MTRVRVFETAPPSEGLDTEITALPATATSEAGIVAVN